VGGLAGAVGRGWERGAAPAGAHPTADPARPGAPGGPEAEAAAGAVPVHVVSALRGEGLEALSPYVARGRTAVLVGSSGVGKSTLTNALAGEELHATRAVRTSDDRGRHATTARHLVVLPSGGLLVDTPGLRELGLFGGEEGLAASFADIEALAADCRFRDCRHGEEPGCAVRAAAEDGRLDPARLESHGRLAREAAYAELRQEHAASWAEKKRWRAIMARARR
jgi:ribosome biogenesis GTPase